jgi:L-threonylcarbamoyladenylate synthase
MKEARQTQQTPHSFGSAFEDEFDSGARERLWPATPDNIARAARLLREGGLVAFPTETVYGLGAHAMDPSAVEKIFQAKERPSYNPLIVHGSDAASLRSVVREWPAHARELAEAFWPGPLTLVLPREASVPSRVCAGLDTVGVRVPAHPVARELLRQAGVPVAAPSANLFMSLSPTRAEHVWKSLGSRVDAILDGGPTDVGIESSVLDLSQSRPVLLRFGAVTRTQIEEVIGPIRILDDLKAAPGAEAARPSPGMLDRHYAPRARTLRFRLREDAQRFVSGEICRVALLSLGRALAVASTWGAAVVAERVLPLDPAAYARGMYAALHSLDDAAPEVILIEMPPDLAEWRGVRDRLSRASQPLFDGS